MEKIPRISSFVVCTFGTQIPFYFGDKDPNRPISTTIRSSNSLISCTSWQRQPALFLWSNQTLEKVKSFWTQAKRSLFSCILIYQRKKRQWKAHQTSGFISSNTLYMLWPLTFSPFEVTFIIFLNASLLVFRDQHHWNAPFLNFATILLKEGGETLHLKGRKK